MKLFKENRTYFPDPSLAPDDGLVDVRDDISFEMLFEAYSFGIFPWPHEGYPILWFCPPQRGVLFFENLHIPKSLNRRLRTAGFEISINRNFLAVIEACAEQPRPGQTGTWITDRLKEAYLDFHQKGYAHSVECWREGKLVGGLYGVFVGGYFCGESMFHHESDSSKACLIHLIEVLKASGHEWMDIQMVTPHLEKMGGVYVPRAQFLQMVEEAKKSAMPFLSSLSGSRRKSG